MKPDPTELSPDRPNFRRADSCSTCAFVLGYEGFGAGGWCCHGVSDDPATWPTWWDRDEDLDWNRHNLEPVNADDVCDAFKRKEIDNA